MTKTFKIFQMNDCDWYLARSLTEAKAGYSSLTGATEYEMEDARELQPEELERLWFWDGEDRNELSFEHWQCECGAMADNSCRWNGHVYEHHHDYPIGHVEMKNIHRRTFQEELDRLIAGGLAEPDIFATTEY